MFDPIDFNRDDKICFEEFKYYIERRSTEFKKVYDKICDQNRKCKHISAADMRDFLKELDMEASDNQIRSFITKIDTDNNGVIYFEEFQAFFALLPHPLNAHAIFDAFQNQLVIDEGEYTTVVQDLTRDPLKVGQVILKLGFGAVAGAVSRTVTAPIDRLKILLQIEKPGK